MRRVGAAALAFWAVLVAPPVRAVVDLQYWEKWNRAEQEAMEAVVRDFNASQDRIRVHYVSISNVDEKALTAIAGGDPPDIAGLSDFNVVGFADQSALIPLDDYLAKSGIDPATYYLPSFWKGCQFRRQAWALPTTPATVGLHWNKEMFRQAGLDPEKPPRSIDELDRLAERLTRRDPKTHAIEQMGFLPWEPGWWNWAWPYFFGGELWNGVDTITCDSPACVQAMTWVQSYARKYGVKEVQVFSSGFGNFSSPQNAFMARKVAMEIQGTWMYNFIQMYAPKLQWGLAPFPTTEPRLYGRSITDMDVICIPKGARHPDESWEFIRYVISQPAMEKLCLGQRKFTALQRVSPGFVGRHPNREIPVFMKMGRHPLTFALPRLTFWNEYQDELNNAFQSVELMIQTPQEAMAYVKAKMQQRLDREIRRCRRLGIPLA